MEKEKGGLSKNDPNRLSDLPHLELPIDFPFKANGHFIAAYYHSSFAENTLSFLRQLRERTQTDLSLLLLVALKVLLARYSQQDDVAIATRFSSLDSTLNIQSGTAFRRTIVRTKVNRRHTFADIIKGVRRSAHEAISNSLPSTNSENRRGDQERLQISYAYFSTGKNAAEVTPQEIEPDDRSDLFFILREERDKLSASLRYDANLFEPSSIQRIIGHIQTLIEGINSDLPIRRLRLLPEQERQTLLTEWNTPELCAEVQECLHQSFEAEVKRSPEAKAVVFENQVITYGQLNSRANQVAHYLQSLGVRPDHLVGLCFERGIEMIISLLGILKAGGAYVPLDPANPVARLAFMIDDCQAAIVLTDSELGATLKSAHSRIICLDTEAEKIGSYPVENPVAGVRPEHLAYVIYTSGSTGQPKGTLISHQNVARLFSATQRWFKFDRSDIWTLFHSYGFDFSVWEIWGALLYGGRLVIVPDWICRSPNDFLSLLNSQRVTVLNQTPSAFRQLIAAEENSELSLQLRYVIFGGEALEFESLSPWYARHRFDSPQLVNMYGITETTVHVTYFPLTEENFRRSHGSNIGVRIPDLRLYVLDRDLAPMPIGLPGEIFVAGPGLARGYLNRPQLTAEKFISNPFEPRSLLYRTGDLARFLPDGNMEYLGRLDQQVKIRGFRIELGEIETVLNRHPLIRECAVLEQRESSGGKQLKAYLVLKESSADLLADLRRFLAANLPEYMAPSYFAVLEQFPLTLNGKLDRKALSQVNSKLLVSPGEARPTSDAETMIAEIWREVLGIQKIDVNENFFDAGGDSINVTEVHGRLRSIFGARITVPVLFEYSTIRSLAKHLTSETKAGFAQGITDRAVKQKEAFAVRKRFLK